jgi:hypothetical protein
MSAARTPVALGVALLASLAGCAAPRFSRTGWIDLATASVRSIDCARPGDRFPCGATLEETRDALVARLFPSCEARIEATTDRAFEVASVLVLRLGGATEMYFAPRRETKEVEMLGVLVPRAGASPLFGRVTGVVEVGHGSMLCSTEEPGVYVQVLGPKSSRPAGPDGRGALYIGDLYGWYLMRWANGDPDAHDVHDLLRGIEAARGTPGAMASVLSSRLPAVRQAAEEGIERLEAYAPVAGRRWRAIWDAAIADTVGASESGLVAQVRQAPSRAEKRRLLALIEAQDAAARRSGVLPIAPSVRAEVEPLE